MSYNKRLWLDVETTGVDSLIHGVVQIAGMIEVDQKIVQTFNFTCRPVKNKHIEPKSLEIIGKTKSEILAYPDPKKVASSLMGILNEADEKYHPGRKFTICGYNTGFDIDFLRIWFSENMQMEFMYIQNWRPVDVLAFARIIVFWGDKKLNKLGNFRLGTLCALYDIPINAHDALSDITATRSLWIKLQSVVIKKMRK